jgi:(1->4)-alpha-D-glucan 1-alpha-D-glucosylmutase
LSLADPDNRRPIDFAARSAALAELNNASAADLLEHWHDGRLKLWVASKMLRFRRDHAALFSEGEYHPIPVQGERAKHVVAFARHLHGQWCVVAVPRLFASLTRVGSPPLGKKVWGDTRIELPGSIVGSGIDVFTGEDASSSLAANLFMKLPVSVASYR